MAPKTAKVATKAATKDASDTTLSDAQIAEQVAFLNLAPECETTTKPDYKSLGKKSNQSERKASAQYNEIKRMHKAKGYHVEWKDGCASIVKDSPSVAGTKRKRAASKNEAKREKRKEPARKKAVRNKPSTADMDDDDDDAVAAGDRAKQDAWLKEAGITPEIIAAAAAAAAAKKVAAGDTDEADVDAGEGDAKLKGNKKSGAAKKAAAAKRPVWTRPTRTVPLPVESYNWYDDMEEVRTKEEVAAPAATEDEDMDIDE